MPWLEDLFVLWLVPFQSSLLIYLFSRSGLITLMWRTGLPWGCFCRIWRLLPPASCPGEAFSWSPGLPRARCHRCSELGFLCNENKCWKSASKPGVVLSLPDVELLRPKGCIYEIKYSDSFPVVSHGEFFYHFLRARPSMGGKESRLVQRTEVQNKPEPQRVNLHQAELLSKDSSGFELTPVSL